MQEIDQEAERGEGDVVQEQEVEVDLQNSVRDVGGLHTICGLGVGHDHHQWKGLDLGGRREKMARKGEDVRERVHTVGLGHCPVQGL